MDNYISLYDLTGIHMLSGVDMSYQSIEKIIAIDYVIHETCQVVNFVLDGVCYTAIEDPCDGYRSCMKEIFINNDYKCQNTFEPQKVFCYIKSDGDKVLMVYDVITALPILKLGTGNDGDYYPYWELEYNPENMSINKK